MELNSTGIVAYPINVIIFIAFSKYFIKVYTEKALCTSTWNLQEAGGRCSRNEKLRHCLYQRKVYIINLLYLLNSLLDGT